MKQINLIYGAFRQNKKVLIDVGLFIVIILSFHYLYRYFVPVFIQWPIYQNISSWLIDRVFYESAWFVQSFLYDVELDGRTMLFPNGGYIAITSGCSGLKPILQLIVLFILFPGPWKKKLWFIPLGVIIVHLTNLFRIISLSVVVMKWPKYWDFSHDWILRPFFYVVIFTLWWFWNEKMRAKS